MKTQRTMKRATGLLLTVVMVVITMVAAITANAADPIQFTVTSPSGAEGSNVVVSVMISENSGLAAADLVLNYDSTKLTFVSAVKGAASLDGLSAINGALFERVKDAFAATYGITAGGSMLDVTFNINSGWTGSTPVTLTHGKLYNSNFDRLYSEITNGAVSIAANTYTVNYNGSDATSGATASSQHTYGVESALTPNGFAKTEHSFSGWTTTQGGGTVDYANNALLNLTALPNDIVTFYAVWALNQYTINFELAGGIDGPAPITQGYDTDVVPPTTYPTRTGHTFNGWLPTVPLKMPSGGETCVAQWITNQYTMSFNSLGGSAVADITQNYNTTVTPPGDPTKEGYSFVGWLPDVLTTMPAYNTQYEAKWLINAHELTVNPNSGTWSGSATAQNFTQNYATTKTIADPTRTGYTFTGWTLTGQGSFSTGTKTYTFGPTSNSTATLTAGWTASQYTITLNLDGGTGTSSLVRPYGTSIPAPTAPSKPNYNFAGWYKEAGLVNLIEWPYIVTANETFYAKWTAIANVTITFDADGGTGGQAATLMQSGTTLTAPADPTKDDYLFAGWNPGVPVTVPDIDTTYTAIWVQIGTEVTITKIENDQMIVNIKGWTPTDRFQIWSNQSVSAGLITGGEADAITVSQWILSMPYAAGSAGDLQTDGSINFTIDASFDSPDENYTIAVRVADADYTFLREVRDSYTRDDVNEVVIRKILVDGVYAKETEIKEIKPGAEVLMSVLCNDVSGTTTYSATVKETNDQLTVTNVNKFYWNISALDAGTYTVEFKAVNGGNISTREVEFQLYSSTAGITYGSISDMALTATGNTITINPSFMNGSFWFQIGESGKTPIDRVGLFETAQGIQYTVTAPGIYQVFGFVNRQYQTLIGNAYDDGFVKTIVIPRTATVVIPDPDPDPVTITFNAGGGIGGTAGNQIPGKAISVPAVTREGYVLDGWLPALPAKVPAVATEYTAQWIAVGDLPAAVTITFNAGGGIGGTAGLQTPGQPLSVPTVTREGYVLDGWVPALPAKVPASPTTYTAQWKLPPGPVDPPSSKVTLTANVGLTDVQKGTPVTFTAAASIVNIGNTAVQYSFWRYDAKGWVLIKDWSLDSTLKWTPARVGAYSIQVRAKGANAGSYEAISSVEVVVTDSIDKVAQVNNIFINTGDLMNAQARTPILIKASAIGADKDKLLYKFNVTDSAMGARTLQQYSINSNCVWVPRTAGTYTISVLVKNETSFGKYDMIKDFVITVQ
ncbi:MAG: hypothetical protein GXZ02_11365 [Clostridiales bacterium]|nr:hypothetical protein [Clostridiales bacterium]